MTDPIPYKPAAASCPDEAGTIPPAPKPAWMQRWDQDEFEINQPGLLRVGGALLKAQGQVARDLLHEKAPARYALGCLIVTLLATLAYGAIIGSAAGPGQSLYAALKLPLVVLGSGAICLPSFYVFQCLQGARPSLAQAALGTLLLCAAAGLIVAACAPVVWFFSISIEAGTAAFLVLLHVSVVVAAIGFGIHLLARMHRYVRLYRPHRRLFHGRVLALWVVMYLLVAAQMASFLGPLMDDGEFFRGERRLFLSAFVRALK